MARLDDLVARVAEPALKRELEAALADTKQQQRFGLVFEEHIPEMSALVGLPVQIGSLVQRRAEPSSGTLYRVNQVSPGGKANVEPIDGGEPTTVAVGDLLVVKRFGEPIYPALTPLGSIRWGADDKPHHAVINGENFHALQLLVYQFEGQVDCIYLDPPYNTGAKDWKYNNRYVDDTDVWRHSKWLSMMEKRLRLAKRLLKPDGVLIVTIDEHEVHHLGMLLERTFPEYLRYSVAIVINPKGTYKQNFGRVEEYAFFCCPPDREVIVGRPTTTVQETLSDLDIEIEDDPDYPEAPDLGKSDSKDYEDLYLRRRGQESSFRRQRPNQFYAMLVDEQQRKVVGVGPLLGKDEPWEVANDGDVVTVYPVDSEGNERTWRYVRETMMSYIEQGVIVVGQKTKNGYALNHRKPKTAVKRLKTVWWDKAHDAGVHGTNVVTKLLGSSGLFPFPKSVYAVRDCLAAVCRERRDALIVDCFAGSGTTLHAITLLNAEDDGSRRCILVTNNEVQENDATALNKEGYYRGSPEFERRGIFEQVTK